MTERVASFQISLGLGDETDITSALASLRTKFSAAVASIEATTRKVTLFEGLQEKMKASADAMAKAAAEAEKLAGQLAAVQKSGAKATEDLVSGLKVAQQEVKATTVEYNRNVDALTKMQTALTRAGVDTKNLAAEQQRLAAASRAAADAAAVQASQQLLGLKTLKDITPEIQRLNAAYNTLAASGTLSVKELAQAQQQLKERVAELRSQVTGIGAQAKEGAGNLAGFFTGSLAPALGLTVSVGALVAGIQEAVAASRQLKQAGAEIAQATNLTAEQIAALETGAKALSERIGIDLVEAMQALREIVRSTGFGSGDALTVLDASAEAAKGSFTDLNAVIRVSTDLISAYGLTASELRSVLDGITASAKAGGPTFVELAGAIGNLAVVAHGIGVGPSELVAMLNVMTSASGDAAGSISALQRIMASFNTDAVRTQLHNMGIEATNFSEVMKELSAKGIPLTQIIAFGVASGKTAVGVEALTRSVDDNTAALKRQEDALGSNAAALEKYKQSPKGLSDQIAVEWQKTKVIVGDYLNSSSALGNGFVALQKFANDFLMTLLDAPRPLQQLSLGAAGAADALALQAAAAREAQKALEANRRQSDDLAQSLSVLSTRLTANAKAIQDATAANLTLITKAAADEIAMLDQSTKARTETAAKTLQIQLDLGEKTLALLKDNEKKITAATDAAIAARKAAATREGKDLVQINEETNRLRKAMLETLVAVYEAEYNRLTALHRGYLAKVNQGEIDRIAFNENIERQLFDIRIASLSSFDQYVAKVKEAERLVALAQKEATDGRVEESKKFATQAIGIAGSITEAFSTTGAEIISKWDATNTRTRIIEDSQKAVNLAFTNAGAAAQKGADETRKQLGPVKEIVEQYRDALKQVNDAAAKGATIKIAIDQASATTAEKELATLARDRTVNLIVNTIKGSGIPENVDVTGGIGGAGTFARGGLVGRALASPWLQPIGNFAAGGPVFRRLAGSKVPGSGDGDTQPALLEAGSYVTSKPASAHYGDTIMGRLAQFFAGGGNVLTPGEIASRILGGGLAPSTYTHAGGDASPWPARASTPEELARLHDIKVAAEREIQAILDRASGLPAAKIGQDVRDFVRRVLELIRNSNNVEEASSLLDNIVVGFNRFYPGIENAKQFHVPLVMGGPGAGLEDFGPGQPSAAFNALLNRNMINPFSGGPFGPNTNRPIQVGGSGGSGGSGGGGWTQLLPLNWIRFAKGGSVDTVPAMLTPGEFVLSPPAVAKVSRLFGTGFLGALNSMRVPRNFFDGMFNLAPPRPLGFAAGGLVPGGAQSFATGGAVTGRPGVTLNLTINTQTVDEAEVRRTIVPAIDRLMRRSK